MFKIIIAAIVLTITACVYVEKCVEKHYYEKVEEPAKAVKAEQEK